MIFDEFDMSDLNVYKASSYNSFNELFQKWSYFIARYIYVRMICLVINFISNFIHFTLLNKEMHI